VYQSGGSEVAASQRAAPQRAAQKRGTGNNDCAATQRLPSYDYQAGTVTKQKATTAQQQKGMEVLTATLKEQASQIQKVTDSLELRVSDPRGLTVSDSPELSKATPQMLADNQ